MQFHRLTAALVAAVTLQAPAWAEEAFAPGVSLGVPIGSGTLEALRGGTDTTSNDMRLAGTASGNTAQQVRTGNNDIAGGAFASLSGIPVVIQNTGANVLIQNAVILNLNMQ